MQTSRGYHPAGTREIPRPCTARRDPGDGATRSNEARSPRNIHVFVCVTRTRRRRRYLALPALFAPHENCIMLIAPTGANVTVTLSLTDARSGVQCAKRGSYNAYALANGAIEPRGAIKGAFESSRIRNRLESSRRGTSLLTNTCTSTTLCGQVGKSHTTVTASD